MEDRTKILLWEEEKLPHADDCGDQAAPSITIYYPQYRKDGQKNSPGVVLVCPGGGYTHKAEHEGEPIAYMINMGDMAAAVLDYRVSPCPHGVPLGDAQRAIRLLRSMGYEKVAILGFSAGGNLACNAATHYDLGDPKAEDPVERFSCRPDGLISCYSVVSLVQNTHVGSLMSLLGKDYWKPALQRYYSAELNVTCDTPPAFIWHTAEDGAVPVENSLSLAAAYSRAGVPFELHVFPEGHHGIGLANGFSACAWPGLCQSWLKRQGYAGRYTVI